MHPQPLIRRAEASDAGEITDCVREAYRHYLPRMDKPPGPMLADYREIVRRYSVFVAVGGVIPQDAGSSSDSDSVSRIVGVLVLMPDERSILLDNVAVHPKWQGRGLGGRLIEFAEVEAGRLGFTHLNLYTHECMVENIALYQRLGYAKTDSRIENGYARVYLRKKLPHRPDMG